MRWVYQFDFTVLDHLNKRAMGLAGDMYSSCCGVQSRFLIDRIVWIGV